MPGLVIHPKYAPSGKARVWVGVYGVSAAPTLVWQLDGAAVTPAVGSLQPVLPPEMQAGDSSRVFSGVFEFAAAAGSVCSISVSDGGNPVSIEYPVLPAALPPGQNDWFNVLLVSCFHHAENIPGGLKAALKEAQQMAGGFNGRVKQLHLSILMGDQVYLDLPTVANFPGDLAKLAQKFNRDYLTNWFPSKGVYGEALAAAPSICVSDDHEYWNNFPYLFSAAQNTYTADGRERWRKAAQTCYNAYQGAAENSTTGVTEIDLAPLHLMVADGRRDRDPSYQKGNNNLPKTAFADGFLARLRAWVQRVNAADGFGVFVTGQSLLDQAKGWLGKKLTDATMPNFTDYQAVMTELQNLKNDFLLLTGDVHFGRVTRIFPANQERKALGFEVIVSPAALVTTVGMDGVKKVKGWFKSLFGASDPWPRHDAGEAAPPRVDKFLFTQPVSLHGETERQEGDHIGVLSFKVQNSQNGRQLLLKMRYIPAHPDRSVRSEGAAELSHERGFLLESRS